jgi:hypothetical protein
MLVVVPPEKVERNELKANKEGNDKNDGATRWLCGADGETGQGIEIRRH